jgi:hypothetical protein
MTRIPRVSLTLPLPLPPLVRGQDVLTRAD